MIGNDWHEIAIPGGDPGKFRLHERDLLPSAYCTLYNGYTTNQTQWS